jgi:hypothetical protein
MDKIDLIQALKDSNHLSKSEAETAINLFFNKAAFFQGGHGIEGSGGWLRLEMLLKVADLQSTSLESWGQWLVP